MSATTLTNFYRCTIEHILSGCITAWYGSCSAQDHKKLQRVVNVAQSISQTSPPSIDSVYTSRCLRKAASIIKNPTHPGHSLFHLLPSGKRYKSLRSRTNQLKSSFLPAAIIFFYSFVGHGRRWLANIYCPSLVGPRAVEGQPHCCGSGVICRPDQVRTADFLP